jgi:hypothetical protein
LGAAGVEADSDEPGGERFRAAEAVEREHRGDDRVLGRVRGALGADHAPAAPQQHGVVALDQRGERVAVAAAGAADEIGIGRHL